jgi:3-hydroxyisobutyrate dehydrogenase-like beta-hydroxyacid dehydrogenase
VLDAFNDASRYIGPIGAGSVAKLVHNCAGYGIHMVLAEVFSMGVKAGGQAACPMGSRRTGASRVLARYWL